MARALCQDGDNQIVTSDAHPNLVAVSWRSPTRLKMIVRHEADAVYYYDIPHDGTRTVVPLCDGNGRYRLDLVRNVDGAWATVTYVSHRVDASAAVINDAYLSPSGWCSWSKDGPCMRAASELRKSGKVTGAGVIAYVGKHVSYDSKKADRLRGGHGYVPDPDRTLADGKGICSDIASATCALMRCVGIPARLVAGYIMPERVSHAWVEALVDGRWATYDPTSLMSTTKRASKRDHKYQAVCRW